MGKRSRPQQTPKREPEDTISARWGWIALAVIVVSIAAIRIRLLPIPLERDEGEYAYAGQLLLQGIPPYRLAYNMKMPGIYYAYALVMGIFGQSVIGIHLGLLAVNAGAILLMFFLGRRLCDSVAGLAAAAAYGVLTVNQWVYGPQAHATHFIVLPAIGGLLLLLEAAEARRPSLLLSSALLLGVGFTMKQQGIFFIIFALLYLVWSDLRRGVVGLMTFAGRVALFVIGASLPTLVVCAVLMGAGVFDKFWFWAFGYAGQYVSETPIAVGMEVFLKNTRAMLIPNIFLWLLAGLGLILSWVDSAVRRHGVFITGFFLFGFLTVCPGLYFRPHYYVTWMPALASLIGVTVGAGRNLLLRAPIPRSLSWISPAVFVLALLSAVNNQAGFLFSAPVSAASHMMYGASPWDLTREIALYIRQRSAPSDTIAVLGSEPQIYFFADRKSATGYIYAYPLMEAQKFAHQMQVEMIGEIERVRPRYMVLVGISQSWEVKPASDRAILEWQGKYLADNYTLAGFAQSRLSGPGWYDYRPEYVWGRDVLTRRPDPKLECIYLFEKKEN